jgi:putrescine aminotransferase
MHAQGGLPIPGIVHIEQPCWFELGQGMSRDDFGLKAAGWLEDRIARSARQGRRLHRRAGAGAGRRDRAAGHLLAEIQRICDRLGILVVSDEVICGFGRTGQWFRLRDDGFRPTS